MLTRHLLQRYVLQAMREQTHTHALTDAAVLLGIDAKTQQLLLTRRSAHLRHHPSQISFPGGKYEQRDLSLAHTALRETREELGVGEQHIEIVGRLPKQHTVSGFCITPFVALLHHISHFQPDPNEVAEVLHLPLAPFIKLSNYHCYRGSRQGREHRVYFIEVEGKMVWGATAKILRDFARHCA